MPPTGKPISIEISGDDYEVLKQLSKRTERYIDSLNIGGIEDLRSDLQEFNPEIVIDIDRERANREGISTGCAANPLRYCPGQAVTRAEMAVFLTRTFGLPLP